MGPVMIDVQGTSLSQEDKEILKHPLVGGLILFTRNFESVEQISNLTKQIRKSSHNEILIAVDHEGGRVQRFRDGFSIIPAMGDLLSLAGNNLERAKSLATQAGTLMALEVQAVGIDISFAPVLDVNGISEVIGLRAFDSDPSIITPLASAFIDGMNVVGMQATGKHFPGHGSVKADSHIALPIDPRSMEAVQALDIKPFVDLINAEKLGAMMPAHIVFSSIDSQSVGFSPFWLQQILREQLGFNGVIFSDDLSMHGASCVGGFIERAEAAQQAGCDKLVDCNDRNAQIEVLDKANISLNDQSQRRLRKMLNSAPKNWPDLKSNEKWLKAKNSLELVTNI
mgnify:FL=1